MDRSSLAECVVPHAVAVAQAFGSQITLLHVMETVHQAHWRRALDPLNWQIRKTEAQTYLNDQALCLREIGVEVQPQILEGPAAEQIIEFAHAQDMQLILLSSHGQSGLSGWNVSGVVLKVILRACTSVMIVRAYQHAATGMKNLNYRRMLVPMDGSRRAECVLPIAATLARGHDTEILLAQVVSQPEMPRRTPPTPEDVDLADRVGERNRTEAIQYLGELCSRFSGQAEARVLVGEHAASTLHELVDEEQIDLVLLTAHGCSGQTRWPYGSVVSSFITYGTAPVLIMQHISQDGLAPSRAERAAREYGRQS